MTDEEIMRIQAEWKAFVATPAGAAFAKFKSAAAHANRQDATAEVHRNLTKVWEAAEKAEEELVSQIKALQAAVPKVDPDPYADCRNEY